MTHTYEGLQARTVVQLREIAGEIEHDALAGYTTMHKDHLLRALCEALGIEAHVHHEVVGIDKSKMKAKIRALKEQRQEALQSGDRSELKRIRGRIKKLKRTMRRATV